MIAINIDEAIYKGGYKIDFLFSDGTENTVDFGDFLKKAKNPMIKKYLDKKLFESFALEYGDIHWNDFEMCFPVCDLHEGNL